MSKKDKGARNGRPRIAYGYARVSTSGQVTTGHSLEAQEGLLKAYYQYRLEPLGATWGGVFVDRETRKGQLDGVSGRVPLGDRPAGQELCARLVKGDHVLFVDLSRGFRRFSDAIQTLELWQDLGVTAHFTRDNIDTASQIGRMMLRFLAIFCEWEREMISERTREALRARKAQGGVTGGMPPIGQRYEGKQGHRRLVTDPNELAVMDEIARLHDQEELSFTEIFWVIKRAGVTQRDGREWSRTRLYRAYLLRTGKATVADEEGEAVA